MAAATARSVSVLAGSLVPVVCTSGRGSPGRFNFPDSVAGITSSTEIVDGMLPPNAAAWLV
jgi:hypothetical protein